MAQEFREPYTISSHLARHALLATDLPLGRLPKLVAHAPVRAALVCDCPMFPAVIKAFTTSFKTRLCDAEYSELLVSRF